MKWLNFIVEKDVISKAKIVEVPIAKYFKIKLIGVIIGGVILLSIGCLKHFFVFPYYEYFYFASILLFILLFKAPYLYISYLCKKKMQQVYYDFPLWLSSLEVLIMSNNIPNTLKKSLATCPSSFKKDLIKLVEGLEQDPTNQSYYTEFLSQYHFPDVTEMMLDLYQFNYLNKSLMVREFSVLHRRLNAIASSNRQYRNEQNLFFIGAINSIPLFLLSVYILMMANMLSNVLMGG